MTNRAGGVGRVYETSIDRAGLALAVGSALGGALLLLLVYNGGQRDPIALVKAFTIGAIFVGIAITAVATPLWLVMHVAGWRKARHAAFVGIGTAMAILVGAQTYGFGLFPMPVMDNGTLIARWISAVLTSLVLAIGAGLIGMVMWRIAYRRQR